MQNDKAFWQGMNDLVKTSEIRIDRPKGSKHPRYTEVVYPLDYGYLKDTLSMDGDGIDVWQGSQPENELKGIMCIIDLMKREAEVKLLVGCTEAEIEAVYRFHNKWESMKGILIKGSGE